MRSGRAPLNGDFNSQTKKFSTPVTKQTASFQTSPTNNYQSPTTNPKVINNEKVVCQKEDDFLSELKEFHAEVNKYEQLKDQLYSNTRKLAKDSISLLSLASNLSVYQQKLEQRATVAQQVLSEPIDDLEAEKKLVEQLEKDVASFREKVPKPPTPDEIQEVEKKLHQAEQLQSLNIIKTQELEKRKVFLENEEKKISAEMKEYKYMQEEENKNEKSSDKEDEKNSTPDENEASKENIRQLHQKKAELQNRRQELDNRSNNLDELELRIQKEKEEHQNELDELQKKLDELTETKNLVDKDEIDLNEIAGIKAQLEIDHADIDVELARMKRVLEAQKDELGKVDRKKAELDRRKKEIEEKKGQIEDKTNNISQRREVLKKSEEEYNVLVDELDEAKRILAEKQAKLTEEQKIVSDYQEKIRQLNGDDEEHPNDSGEQLNDSGPFEYV